MGCLTNSLLQIANLNNVTTFQGINDFNKGAVWSMSNQKMLFSEEQQFKTEPFGHIYALNL